MCASLVCCFLCSVKEGIFQRCIGSWLLLFFNSCGQFNFQVISSQPLLFLYSFDNAFLETFFLFKFKNVFNGLLIFFSSF